MPELKKYKMFINGEWVNSDTKKTFETLNPENNKPWAIVPEASESDVDRAVKAAQNAFEGEWPKLLPKERARFLRMIGDKLRDNAEHLGKIETIDTGKLYRETYKQANYIAEYYDYYAGLADKVEGTVLPIDKPNIQAITTRIPIGVIAAIVPWNSQMFLTATKLAPALAAGNCSVLKPAEQTPASIMVMMELIGDLLPPGVVNIVSGFGLEAGKPLASSKRVAKVAFTGSDLAGQKIYETAAKKIMPVTLELGGKSPNIVFEDADFEAAVMGAISGIFAATGQTCIAGSRLLVQRTIHDKFVKRLVEVASEAKIGDPMSVDTHVGPVTTAPQYDKILQYIEVAKEDGATCVLGGKPYTGDGIQSDRFVEPTIFTGVKNNMRIAQEEVFGPILSVIPFDTEEDAIRIGNDIVFGLAAGVWTSDLGRAFRMSEKLKAGTVWVNTYRAVSFMTPFGGYKRSGQGRESGQESIKEFMQVKSVWIAQQTTSSNPFIMQ